jgi:hypothetical protein
MILIEECTFDELYKGARDFEGPSQIRVISGSLNRDNRLTRHTQPGNRAASDAWDHSRSVGTVAIQLL